MSRFRPIVALLLLALILPAAIAARPVVAQDGAMIDNLNGGGFGGGSNPQSNFNPYVPATRLSAFSYIYEPLVVTNLYSCEPVPWLATDWSWTDPQTLVMTMRDGVTWSDGTPFTGADVEFTFAMLYNNQALDERGLWRYLTGVVANGQQVTFTFNEPGAYLWVPLVETVIVPKHLWEGQADPVTFTNDNPVGTGPFLFKSFNGQQLQIERNPNYWQADKVKIQQMTFTKPAEGQVDQLQLAEGKYDWNSMFVPDIENTYVAKDPENNKYWFPQGGIISLYLNLTKAPFDDVEFRRGLAYAIDRDEIVQKAQFGYVSPASQTGLNLPGMQDYLDPALAGKEFIPYDPAQAEQIFTAAGYTKNGDGKLLGKDGNPIQFSFSVPTWNDWIQAAQIIQEDLAQVGITMDVQTMTPEIAESDRWSGNFDATFGVQGGSCAMYRNYFDPLASAQTKPIGEPVPVGGNAVRWQDPETDQFLAELKAAPDAEAQKPALYGLQNIMVNELPVITLWYGGIWFEYRTVKADNWPNADNPYAHPNNGLLIVTNLVPKQQ